MPSTMSSNVPSGKMLGVQQRLTMPTVGFGLRRASRTSASSVTKDMDLKTAWALSNGTKIELSPEVVRFGFPKGSLQKSTENLFDRAGFQLKISERNYFPQIDDEHYKLVLFRSQEISRFVEDGVLDAGICGKDWIVENNADVVEVCELQYSKATTNAARWVLAVTEDSPIKKAEDLEGEIVVSELVHTTERFFEERNINVKKVEYSWGATEVKAVLPGIGAIVDITETGSSLRANKLRVVDTIMSSTTRLIANKEAWEVPEKRRHIEDLGILLKGAILGRRKVGLKMNIARDKLSNITNEMPSTLSPTLSPLVDDKYVALEVVIDESLAREIISTSRRLGASGIFTYPLKCIIPDE